MAISQMKLEHNWRQKNLENLEKDNWGAVPEGESSIVQRSYRFRKVPLEAYTTDDIRFMIGQQIGLSYLLISAIELLQKDLFVEGNYYEGDLLAAVLHITPSYWKGNREQWLAINQLIEGRLDELRAFRPRLEIDNFYAVTFD